MGRPHWPSRKATPPTDLQSTRSAMLLAVKDCSGLPAQHLQLKIHSARTHRDLWMLRSEAYHLISMQHCQAVANERIDALLHTFEGWVTPQDLSRAP